MNENQSAVVKGYNFNKRPNHKIDSIFDNCFRVCKKNIFIHSTYNNIHIQRTNNGKIGKVFITISDKA